MPDDGRVITAKVDEKLVTRLDEAAERLERSKSWVVREALEQWLAEDQLRYELTMEALSDVDDGRTVDQAEVESWAAERRKKRAKAAAAA